jgi:hypothetical protein
MRKILSVVVLCCVGLLAAQFGGDKSNTTPASGLSITFDAVSNATPVTTGTTISWTHTTSGSNRALFVCVAGDNAGVGAGTACTYNGVAMTSLWHGQDDATVYGSTGLVLANPASGANTIACTLASSTTIATAAATSWDGVNQSTPNRTPTSVTGPGTSSPVTVTTTNSQSGDVVVDCTNVFGASSTIASGTTSRFVSDNVSATTLTIGTSSAAATGASQVMNYTGTPDAHWFMGAAPLIP